MIKGKFYKEKNMYESFSDTFKAIVNCKTLFNEQRSLWNRFYFSQKRQQVYR